MTQWVFSGPVHAWDPLAQFFTLRITVVFVFACACVVWIAMRRIVFTAWVGYVSTAARYGSVCHMYVINPCTFTAHIHMLLTPLIMYDGLSHWGGSRCSVGAHNFHL